MELVLAVYAAAGGSSNAVLHHPAICFSAGVKRPGLEDWLSVSRKIPRLVDVIPNGPGGYTTVQVFLAGGVPEIMLRLRTLNLLNLDCLTVSGLRLGYVLENWGKSDRRAYFKELLKEKDGVDADDVIATPEHARSKGMTATITFPKGNLAPNGSIVKVAIDPELFDKDGVYRDVRRARVFIDEKSVMKVVKSTGSDRIVPGDAIVLICRGPIGAGMPEVAQITNALKDVEGLEHTCVLTDARFSGHTRGANIGHISPEALAGGPIGKLDYSTR